MSSSRSKSRTSIGSITRNKMLCHSDWSTPKYKRNCSHTSAMTNPETMKTKRLPERLEIFDSLVACDHNHTLLWWIHKTSTAFIVNFWLNNIFWQHVDDSLVKWAIAIIMFINKSRISEKLSKWIEKIRELYWVVNIISRNEKTNITPMTYADSDFCSTSILLSKHRLISHRKNGYYYDAVALLVLEHKIYRLRCLIQWKLLTWTLLNI